VKTSFFLYSRFTLFFVQKKSAAKEVKKPCRLYRPYQFRFSPKVLSPPRVEILRSKIYSEPQRIFAIFKFFALCKVARAKKQSIRAYSAFADHRKFVKRSHASRFRGILRDTSKITAGRGATPTALFCTDKAINLQGFWFFLPLFLSKRKRGME
jgi:hypothetical protein